MNNKKILHILMTEYSIDSRVTNETKKLVEEGFHVDVYCLNGPNFKGNEEREQVNIYRFGTFGNKWFLFLSAYFSMFIVSLKTEYKCIHSHDLTALPIGFFISVIKRIPLIYDSHELWSHALHRKVSNLVIKFVIRIEKILAKRADYIITVSNSIAEHLKSHFDNQNVFVVRNVPSYTHKGEYDLFRSEMGLPKNCRILLYQGLISKERGVGYLLEAAILLNRRKIADYKFIFMGDGPYTEYIKLKIKEMNIEDNVVLIPPVGQSELLKYTSSADIGVHAINNSCLNHDYCLPNKLFEYVSAGLAVVVTNLTELSKFIGETQIGYTFDDESPEDLADKLAILIKDKQKLKEMKEKSRILREQLTWENEATILMAVYEKALS